MRKAVSRIIPSRSRSSSENESSISSPFKIDFQSVSDFYIILDNPHNSWLPGDEVSGQIILISKKNLVNVVITLSLTGFVKINASSHSKLRPVKHNLFNHTIKIYGDQTQPNNRSNSGHSRSNESSDQEYSNGLFKGEHRFPFIVKLPNKRIFTSIDFGKGSISYSLKASMINSSQAQELTSSNLSKLNSQSSDSSLNNPNSSTSILSKTKNLKFLHNSNFTSEKLINLINPIDVSNLSAPKPKKLIIKDPRFSKKLSRTQSSNSTINTFNTYSTLSSNNSDSNDVHSSYTHDDESRVEQRPDELQDQATLPPSVPSSLIVNNNDNDNDDDQNKNNNTSTTTTTNNNNNNNNGYNNNGLQVQFEEDQGNISTPIPSSISYDSPKAETIKVTLTIPQRGYLRGELIPIKIDINHLRKIQDVNGIILTFVRVCRLDNGPEGLFDSFRKDLSQAVIPLYVDPITFKSEINTNIRVPADAFPTISGCPLVSFQYFIEVLINLSGKSVLLDTNDQSKSPSNDKGHQSPIIDFQNSNQNSNFDESENIGNLNNGNNNSSSNLNENHGTLNDFKLQFKYLSGSFDFNQKERSTFINTDKHKRMKKFLQLTSEVIIGTHRSVNYNSISNGSKMDIQDSYSPMSHRSSTSDNSPNIQQPSQQDQYLNVHLPHQQRSLTPSNTLQPSIDVIHEQPLEFTANSSMTSIPQSSHRHPNNQLQNSIPNYEEINVNLIPMPNLQLSEKERLRAHESSLLPSEPAVDLNNESPESISPIDRNNEMLMDESEDFSHQPNDYPQDQINDQSRNLNETTQFNFFETSTNDINDINNDQTIDYVPAYESSNKDQLVNTIEHQNSIQNQNPPNSNS